jgi:hypothetical protein
VKTRFFSSVPRKLFWKRVFFPLALLWGASFVVIRDTVARVTADWTNIPAMCQADFPVQGQAQLDCDLFWKSALSHAALAAIPLILVLLGLYCACRIQNSLYQRARKRVDEPDAALEVQKCAESVPEDLFSWVYCLKPARVIRNGEKFTVYLCPETAEPSDGEELRVYQLGISFGKSRWVAVRSMKDGASRQSLPKLA